MKKPTDAELRAARADFRELLSRATPEAQWQTFFSANPFVLSRSLPLRLETSDILPLGRPGRSEPDFLIYPSSHLSIPTHGLVELKTNSARVTTRTRKNILSLTRDADTAVRQLQVYDRDYNSFSPVKRCVSFSSGSHLFVVMGMRQELLDLSSLPDLVGQIPDLFPSNVRFLGFDELFKAYESAVPLRSFILMPDMTLADQSDDLRRLLYYDVSYDGWAYGVAREKCFYLRGITWFRSVVLALSGLPVTRCDPFIRDMKDILASRPSWQGQGFDWAKTYALRQFTDAVSPRVAAPLTFQKAVEALALCEAIATHLSKVGTYPGSGLSVYEHMRIEPAVSFVDGLTPNLLSTLFRDRAFVDQLRRYTCQTDVRVFNDMASGLTVTHKLAERTYHLVKLHLGADLIHPPDFRYDPKRRRYKPSDYEYVSAEERWLPRPIA